MKVLISELDISLDFLKNIENIVAMVSVSFRLNIHLSIVLITAFKHVKGEY